MYDMQQEGSYGRTEAFNLVKRLLGIPKNATINKDFFMLFFRESYNGFFIRKPEEEIREIFSKNNIVELNKQYYKAKESKEGAKVKSISEEIFTKVRDGINQQVNSLEFKKPYFVK